MGAVDEACADDDLVPMTGDPDNIQVIVVGGPGKHTLVVPSWGMTRSVTAARRRLRRSRRWRRSTCPTASPGPSAVTLAPSLPSLAGAAHRGARQRQAQRRRGDDARRPSRSPRAPARRSSLVTKKGPRRPVGQRGDPVRRRHLRAGRRRGRHRDHRHRRLRQLHRLQRPRRHRAREGGHGRRSWSPPRSSSRSRARWRASFGLPEPASSCCPTRSAAPTKPPSTAGPTPPPTG